MRRNDDDDEKTAAKAARSRPGHSFSPSRPPLSVRADATTRKRYFPICVNVYIPKESFRCSVAKTAAAASGQAYSDDKYTRLERSAASKAGSTCEYSWMANGFSFSFKVTYCEVTPVFISLQSN